MPRLRRFPSRHPIASAAILCAALSALMLYQSWLSQQRGPRALPPLAPGWLAHLGARHVPRGTAAAGRHANARFPSAPNQNAVRPAPSASASAGPASARDQHDAYDTAASVDNGVGRENPFEPVAADATVASAAADTTSTVPDAAADIDAAIKRSEQGVGRANPFDPLVAVSAGQRSPIAGAVSSSSPRGTSRRAARSLPPVPPLDPTGPLPRGGTPAGLRLVGFIEGPTLLAVLEDGRRSYIVAPGDVIGPGLRVTGVDAERQRVRLEWHGTPLELSVALQTGP